MAADYLALLRQERDFTVFLLLLCLNGVLYSSFLPFLPIFVSSELGLPQSFTGSFRTCSLLFMALTPVALGTHFPYFILNPTSFSGGHNKKRQHQECWTAWGRSNRCCWVCSGPRARA